MRSPWRGTPASGALRGRLGRIGFWVALAGLGAGYQRQLAALTRVRRSVADVATSRKRPWLHAWYPLCRIRCQRERGRQNIR